jgi:DNA-binding NtrC family response regulator
MVSALFQSGPVLIVDDNDDVREAFEVALELRGFTVRAARNGAEGLRELRRQPTPCAVLLDLHMPDMDGFQFREAQLEDPALMSIPVLLFSGDHNVAAAAARMGIEAFFQKPLGVDEITEFLRRYTAQQAP